MFLLLLYFSFLRASQLFQNTRGGGTTYEANLFFNLIFWATKSFIYRKNVRSSSHSFPSRKNTQKYSNGFISNISCDDLLKGTRESHLGFTFGSTFLILATFIFKKSGFFSVLSHQADLKGAVCVRGELLVDVRPCCRQRWSDVSCHRRI